MHHNYHTYLDAANVSTTSLKDVMSLGPELREWIQAPGIALPDQPKNRREIVGEDDETEPAAVDRPGCLEDLFFLLKDNLGPLWRAMWNGVRVLPGSTLIDLQKFLGDVLITKGNK